MPRTLHHARYLLPIALLALSFSAAAAESTTACQEVFDNGITSHRTNVKLTFDRDAQLLNAPSSILSFNVIQKDNKSSLPTCGTTDCSASPSVAEPMDAGPLLTSSSNVDFTAPDDGSTLAAATYDDVKVEEGETLAVDPSIDEYVIDKLEVDKDATLTLSPGDYWLGELKLEQGAQLVVAGSGTVRIYVDKLTIKDDALVNSPSGGASGDPSKLFLYAYDDVKLEKDTTFSGFIYSERKIETEERVAVFGALSAERNVTLKDNTVVTYDASAIDSTDFGCLCSCNAGDVLDHFRLGASPVGVICEAQTITLTAYRSDGGVHDLYGGSVTLNTSTGLGDWTLLSGSGTLAPGSSNSGTAGYTFAAGDLGQVVLGLKHSTLGTVNVDVVDDELGISELSNTAPPEDPNIDMRSAAFRFYADGLADTVGTQIAGKSSLAAPGGQALALRAVIAGTDSTSCESRLPPGSHTVELAYRCEDPGVCASSNALRVNGSATGSNNAGPILSYLPVTLSFVDNAGTIEAPLDAVHFDSGRTSLHVRSDLPEDAFGPAVSLVGSSNAFVVRPFALGFSNIISGSTSNPGGTAAGGGGFAAAGDSFSFELGAYLYAAADDLDADGVPDPGSDPTDNGITPAFAAAIALQVDSITPAGGFSGTLAPAAVSAAGFGAGSASVSSASYDEAGSVIIRGTSLDYLGDPAADVIGFSPEIGRFYPAYFDLLLDTAGDSCTAGATTFTYMGEPAIDIDYRLLARNAAGQTTLNYDSALGHLTGQVQLRAENADDGTDLSTRISANAGTWERGSYVRPASATSYSTPDAAFARASAPDGPYADLQLGLSLLAEPDGRTIANRNMDPGASGDCSLSSSCTAITLGTPLNLRYGRLRIVGAYGPETMALTVPVVTEYFENGRYPVNIDDGNGVTACTRMPQAIVDLQSGVTLGVPIPLGAGTTTGSMSYPLGSDFFFDAGDAALLLSAPGSGNTGEVSIDLNLSSLPWLRFDWDEDGSVDAATRQGWGTFGRYRGHDRIILWVEQR